MYMIAEVLQYVAVASFAEAWIEISVFSCASPEGSSSPPSRRRGLKLDSWFIGRSLPFRRLLRGGVD